MPGEELDLTDEQIQEMIEISQEYGKRQRESKSEELIKTVTADADKMKNKAITEITGRVKNGQGS